jgi:hypothetical protein
MWEILHLADEGTWDIKEMYCRIGNNYHKFQCYCFWHGFKFHPQPFGTALRIGVYA